MSKENVVLFIKAVNKKPDLGTALAKSTRTADWVSTASQHGFDFNAAELVDVISGTIGKKVTADNAVTEYMAAANSMAKGELDQRALDAVTGGATRRLIIMPPMFIQASK